MKVTTAIVVKSKNSSWSITFKRVFLVAAFGEPRLWRVAESPFLRGGGCSVLAVVPKCAASPW